MTRQARRRIALSVTLAGVMALSACGVGVDDEPRAIAVETTSTTVPDSPVTGPFATELYFSREGLLFPVRQELPDRSIEALLSGVLTGPSNGKSLSGLVNSVPSGTELLGVTRSNGGIVVNLSSAFDNVVGPVRQQAIGQMVMSVTEQFDVETISFEIEGRTLTVSSPVRGDTTEVTECDYASLLPGTDVAANAGLEGRLAEQLSLRRVYLAERCLDFASGTT